MMRTTRQCMQQTGLFKRFFYQPCLSAAPHLGNVVGAVRQLGHLAGARQACRNVAQARQVLRNHHRACRQPGGTEFTLQN